MRSEQLPLTLLLPDGTTQALVVETKFDGDATFSLDLDALASAPKGSRLVGSVRTLTDLIFHAGPIKIEVGAPAYTDADFEEADGEYPDAESVLNAAARLRTERSAAEVKRRILGTVEEQTTQLQAWDTWLGLHVDRITQGVGSVLAKTAAVHVLEGARGSIMATLKRLQGYGNVGAPGSIPLAFPVMQVSPMGEAWLDLASDERGTLSLHLPSIASDGALLDIPVEFRIHAHALTLGGLVKIVADLPNHLEQVPESVAASMLEHLPGGTSMLLEAIESVALKSHPKPKKRGRRAAGSPTQE